MTSKDIITIGILFVCLNTLTGSCFDTISKYLSTNSVKWYHFYSIGGISALLFYLIILSFFGGIKKHIVLQSKKNYIVPILRGITFIPIPIMVFYALKNLPVSLFTTILMMSPFFNIIFSKILLKERLTKTKVFTIFFGFIGVLLVLRPDINSINLSILLAFYVAIYNSFIFIIAGKFSNSASALGYTFYHIIFLILLSLFFLFLDPYMPDYKQLFLILIGGIFLILSMLFWTSAFYIANKYISIISPFFFTQIIWASFFGGIFFNEKINLIGYLGITIIIISGTIAMINSSKKINL